jgi:N-formylglutamate deformylase
MSPFSITPGEGPLVAAAIHAGHDVRPEVLPHLAISEERRLHEEDPFTDELAEVAETRIVVPRSRFEVDLNRPPEKAIYRRPEDAWGITVWRNEPPAEVVARSMAIYESFYAAVEELLAAKLAEHGSVVVFDIHSYNHRRGGADGPVAGVEQNPEVNVGTGTLDRGRWGRLVDRFMSDLRVGGQRTGLGELDVRENVKFRGGYFPEWIHGRFGPHACVLAIEFKKTFMDEWTGEVDRTHLARLREALASTIPGVLEARAEITGVS